jgi:cation diffusion facilitator CzcD-associated flavoprotein CzcO
MHNSRSETKAIIIGAGITGLGAAYYLREKGFSYRILEQSDNVGGIWCTQRWHGARCDSDFIKYSFSFKPFLSAKCVQDRAQIQRYLRSVAEEFGMLERTEFDTRVVKAVFDSAQRKWIVQTTKGVFTARFLFNGNGYFSDPHVPTFRDEDTFRGEIIHTFGLDARRRFAGKDVVLVGSGSTAVCAAPELARVSKSLVLLQRSPSYIYEIDNQASRLTLACQRLYQRGFRVPLRLVRAWLQFRDDLIFVVFRAFPRITRWFFRRHWFATVGAEALRRHFTPRYNPWEQRVSIALGLKEQIGAGRIAIRTGEIERFVEDALVLKSGERIKCDACILATGFDLNILKFDMVVDDAPVDLGGVNFYKGIMMGAVPNYFQPVGVWHSAWTQRAEAATRFAVKIMAYMEENGWRSVKIDRKEVAYTPPITPNYIMRHLPAMPRIYGTYELPSIDNLLSYRFSPRAFRFS